MKQLYLLSKISCLALMTIAFNQKAKAQKDVTPPIIEYKGDSTCIQIGTVWVNKLEVTDNQSDKFNITVTQNWKSSGPLNSLVRGVYVLEVEAIDSNGNKSKRTISLKVDDCIAPEIDLNTPDTVCVKWRTPYNSVAPTATDNYYNKNQVSMTKTGNVNTNVIGVYYEVFEAVDGSLNKTTKTRVIIVAENCGTTSSISQLTAMSINIYPNPAKGYIEINPANTNSTELYNVRLFSMDGKTVFGSSFSNSVKMDVSNFTNGVYSIEVIGGDKVYRQKIVIQH
jgi:hypothetical protein